MEVPLALCTQTAFQYLCVFIVLLTKVSGTSLDVKLKVDRDSISFSLLGLSVHICDVLTSLNFHTFIN